MPSEDYLMDFHSGGKLFSQTRTQTVSTRGWPTLQREIFLHRAQGHARLVHPNILRLLDIQIQGDDIRLVAEAANSHAGECWNVINRNDFVEDLLRVLDFAHQNGLVHGCLCPQNLKLDRGGGLKVWGFGFDWYERASQVTGDDFVPDESFHYVSPESLCGMKKDGRADLYSFGLLLYRVWGKQLGFQENTRLPEKVGELLKGPKLELQDLPEPVAATIEACLRREPTERPRSVGDVMRALGIERRGGSDSVQAQHARTYEILKTDRWEGARETLLRAFELDPNSVVTLNDLGAVSLWTGNLTEAQRYLLQACELDPNEFRCRFNLGLVYLRLEDHLSAVRAFREALTLNGRFGRAHLELEDLPNTPETMSGRA